MTQEHLITPPPELVQQWLGDYFGCAVSGELSESELYLATQAARWGAAQELEACCKWLETGPYGFSIEATAPSMTKRLRVARRPEPPSLAEQALKALTKIEDNEATYLDSSAIRRALERLQELEEDAKP